jgi:hypothetical protein
LPVIRFASWDTGDCRQENETLDTLNQLREIYERKLGKGPFPLADCVAVRLTDREHGIVTMFLADIAGVASHGRRLASITEARKTKFRELVARSFEERWPDTSTKITPERSPTLFCLMTDTDHARLLIMRYLASDVSSSASWF